MHLERVFFALPQIKETLTGTLTRSIKQSITRLITGASTEANTEANTEEFTEAAALTQMLKLRNHSAAPSAHRRGRANRDRRIRNATFITRNSARKRPVLACSEWE